MLVPFKEILQIIKLTNYGIQIITVDLYDCLCLLQLSIPIAIVYTYCNCLYQLQLLIRCCFGKGVSASRF